MSQPIKLPATQIPAVKVPAYTVEVPAVEIPAGEVAEYEFKIWVAHLPPGSTITVWKREDGTWPKRPVARPDIHVIWKGPDPDPEVVDEGVEGMLNNRDSRFVTK